MRQVWPAPFTQTVSGMGQELQEVQQTVLVKTKALQRMRVAEVMTKDHKSPTTAFS